MREISLAPYFAQPHCIIIFRNSVVFELLSSSRFVKVNLYGTQRFWLSHTLTSKWTDYTILLFRTINLDSFTFFVAAEVKNYSVRTNIFISFHVVFKVWLIETLFVICTRFRSQFVWNKCLDITFKHFIVYLVTVISLICTNCFRIKFEFINLIIKRSAWGVQSL